MGPLAALRDGRRRRAPGPVPVAALEAAALAAGLDDPALVADIARAMAAEGSGDPAIVGRVYEQRLAADRAARRAGGAYYTPAHLLDIVVEHTLGRALTGVSAETALAFVVLDPSCGGGAFLLRALEVLEAHCLDAGGAAEGLRRRIVDSCLRGIDVDPVAAAACRLALILAAGPGARPEIRVADALAEDHRAEADVVLGNPPWGQKGFRFPPAEARRLRARYATGRGVLDPFKLFVERAHELCRPGGRWGFVLPDVILLKDQEPVRRLILGRSSLELIADVGRAFEGVNLDAAIITGRLATPTAGHRVEIRRPGHEPEFRPQAMFAALPGAKLNLHLTAEAHALLERLAPLPRLGDRFEIHEGVHTGNARRTLFLDRSRGPGCVPVIVGGRELQRYRLRWGGRWLDRDARLDRAAGEYANLGRPEWHERQKIVVRRTGDHLVAALDRDGRWVSNNLFVVVPRAAMSTDELAAHVAWLNSAFATWYFRTIQPRTGRLYAELKIQHLTDIPLPEPARWAGVAADLAALARAAETEPAADQELNDLVARGLGLAVTESLLVSGS
jgi:adenine-specific DNA-methyltransferase